MFRYIIKKLYGGEISPWDRDIDKDSDRWRQSQKVCQKADALRSILTPELRVLFDEYVDEQHSLGYLIDQDGFIEGFRLGTAVFLAAIDAPDLDDESEENEA